MIGFAKIALARAVNWVADIQARKDVEPAVDMFVREFCGMRNNMIITHTGFSNLSAAVKNEIQTELDCSEVSTWRRLGKVIEDACEEVIKTIEKDVTYPNKNKDIDILNSLSAFAEAIMNSDSRDGTAMSITINHRQFLPIEFLQDFYASNNINEFAKKVGIYSDALRSAEHRHAYSG